MSDANVAIRITVDTGAASASVTQLGANFDQMGIQGFKAARSLTSGLSGLLSAQQNVYTAQQRVNTANISYILTVREYGAGSLQAQKALISLQQAQEGVTIAQDQLNLRYVQFAVTTGPQFYMAITKMIAASQGMTVANYMETASWYAKTAAILTTVVALAAVSGGFSLLVGGAEAAAATTTINQNNTFNAVGGNASGALTSANNSLRGSIRP